MINLLKRIFKRRGVDKTVYFCVVILTIYGIVMIGSASVGQSAKMGPMYASMNMIKQAIFVLGGFAAMIFLTRCFKKSWVNANSTWIFYAMGLVLMLACLFFEDGKGSHAWIRIGSFTIQPAEFMKVIMILFLSFHFGEIEEYCQIPRNITRQKKEELQKRKLWYCILRPILAIFIAFFVGVFLQKDMGSSLIILVIGFILILLSATFILKPYQLGRIYTWLNPLGDIEGDGWQLTNALIAFATGGLFGKGFGSSTQKYGYIPESHNDFIVAIIYEELGLVGFMLFLIPYVIIIYKMFHYALRIKDTKSKLILYGVGLYFFTHLLVNVGGVSGFIPMTGVPLLLISSGGSSTLAAMMGLGIAQSIIAKYNRDLLKEQME